MLNFFLKLIYNNILCVFNYFLLIVLGVWMFFFDYVVVFCREVRGNEEYWELVVCLVK